MLDIIIPHYTESWSIGEKFFSIMDLQRWADFDAVRIILVHDGEENRFPDSFFEKRLYQVTQVSIPHSGVSAARNKGLNVAENEWIMFCDFDDMFTNVYALMEILSVLPAYGKDLLATETIVERMGVDRKITRKLQKDPNGAMLHGFLFRRQFVIESGIRFDTELTYDEDYDFLSRLILETNQERIGKINTTIPPYIYCYNETSVTALTGRYEEKARCLLRRLQNQCMLYERKKMSTEYGKTVADMIYGMYYMLNVKQLTPDLSAIKQTFVNWYQKHQGILKTIPDCDRFASWKRNENWRKMIDQRNTVQWLAQDDIPLFCKDISIDQWLSSLVR